MKISHKFCGFLCFLALLGCLSSCGSDATVYEPLFDEDYLSSITSITYLYSSDTRYELDDTQDMVFDDAIAFLKNMVGVPADTPDESGGTYFHFTAAGEEHKLRLLVYNDGAFVTVDDVTYRVKDAYDAELPEYLMMHGEKTAAK